MGVNGKRRTEGRPPPHMSDPAKYGANRAAERTAAGASGPPLPSDFGRRGDPARAIEGAQTS